MSGHRQHPEQQVNGSPGPQHVTCWQLPNLHPQYLWAVAHIGNAHTVRQALHKLQPKPFHWQAIMVAQQSTQRSRSTITNDTSLAQLMVSSNAITDGQSWRRLSCSNALCGQHSKLRDIHARAIPQAQPCPSNSRLSCSSLSTCCCVGCLGPLQVVLCHLCSCVSWGRATLAYCCRHSSSKAWVGCCHFLRGTTSRALLHHIFSGAWGQQGGVVFRVLVKVIQ